MEVFYEITSNKIIKTDFIYLLYGIFLKLFWDLGVFCDEFGTSPDEVCGGEFGLFMVWLRMGLLFLATIGSALALLHNREQ